MSVPANYPSEDELAAWRIPSKSWWFWSVYDGHVGGQTSFLLKHTLLPNLHQALEPLYSDTERPPTEAIHRVIKEAFLAVDDVLVKVPANALLDAPEDELKTIAARVLVGAHAGSCALVSFYEANMRRLHVSVVGDSRAILGRPRRGETADGKTIYDVHVLSVDQTGKNEAEVARLTAEHPGEALFNDRGRFLGWGITRAFGNGVMKWSKELQEFLQEKCLGDKPRATLLTPPYFTAMPEITTTIIQPGDFMVMASDGLWDCLTNEEVVGLVGAWLGSKKGDAPVIERVDLPVVLTDEKTHYATSNVKKQFVVNSTVVDADDVAQILALNALGGSDRDLVGGLLSLLPPRARQFRDDMSVIVVFFE
ncbi:phosphatase 2C-like domain-containing protein [Mycena alexandri]|uniref:Phosphatase 2C-like domain-containing protein n=1 Tax=Mycena alexandri TaxID=1745969 RepID=A0AAD6XBH0_9AGAR|nr:phosphatase 2C-like domain-containing protein [Mycena alexandri]